MKVPGSARLVLGVVLLTALTAAAQVTASVPYTVSTFATGVAGVYSAPDSMAVLDDHVFIGY
jgi:hypothetical protein